jgi:hypothetical protein
MLVRIFEFCGLVFLIGFGLTQIIMPIIAGRKLFPFFRKKR